MKNEKKEKKISKNIKSLLTKDKPREIDISIKSFHRKEIIIPNSFFQMEQKSNYLGIP